MLLRLLLQREGGTVVDLDGVEYHFAPDSSGNHVCEVSDLGHIERLLSIPEAYEPVKVPQVIKPKSK